MFFHQGLMACNKIKSLGLFCMQRTFWDIIALSRKQENRSRPQCQDFTESLLGLKRPESIMGLKVWQEEDQQQLTGQTSQDDAATPAPGGPSPASQG